MAFDLCGRVAAARGWNRWACLAGGATVMGLGIWSMHFTGMLAFRLPVPVSYHWPTALLSLVTGILAAAAALYIVGTGQPDYFQAFLGSVILGFGISGMHYIGVAAMRLPAVCQYHPFLVTLSVSIAILASLGALVSAFGYHEEFVNATLAKIMGALAMGAAIAVTHFIAMMSVSFIPSSGIVDESHTVGISALGLGGIAIGTLVVEGAALLTSAVDQRFAAQGQEFQASERFRQIADNLQVVLLLANGDFTELLYVNRTYEVLWDRTVESLYAEPKSWLESVHLEDRDRVEDLLRGLIGGRPVDNVEFRIVRSDGSTSWVSGRGFPIRDAQGRPYRLVCSAQDITERKKMEEARRQSEEQYRMVAEAATDAIVSIDESGKISFLSPATTRIFGYTSSELIGMPLTVLMPESLRDSHKAGFHDYLMTDQRYLNWQGVELVGLRKNGEQFPIEVSFGEVIKGSRHIFTGFIRDITERRRADLLLRESEDRYRDIVEHSEDLICTHDLQGRFLSVNEPPARILGYTTEELLNKPMWDFMPKENRAKFGDYLSEIKQNGSAHGLLTVLTKSGERRIWQYSNNLRTEGVTEPIVRGIAHDVTEQKRAERNLRSSEEKFSKAFQASPYAVVISTIEEGRLTDVNKSFLRITGFTREESVGQTSFELGLWNCPGDRDKILSELRCTDGVQSKEINFRTKHGQLLIVNYSAEVIEIGGRRCLLSVCEDITERKRVEEKLREYEKAVEGIEEMIAVVNREYRYLLANRAFLMFRSVKRDQVIGHLASEVLGKDFFERVVKEKMDEAFEGKSVTFEVKYTYPDTGQRELFVSYFPIEGPAGIDRLVCVLHDITERKEAERQLRRLSGQLLQSQDEERRKIARDLHDSTGQDLVALSTMLSQLHDVNPTSRRKWQKLTSQCEAVAHRSLREVRTLSYLLHPPMLDEAGLEDALRHFVEGFSERTGIEVDVDVSPHFGRLPEDTELGLFRVVQESLVNIQRHSGSFAAKIRVQRDMGEITLEVRDEGRGFSAAEHKPNGAVPLAVGVGIPSMQERAKQVGGRLEIQSSITGTTVRVTVPINGQAH